MFRSLLIAAAQNLPYKRRLAYLESTGTQYIDTGLILNSNSRVRIEFPAGKPLTPPTSADFSAFGCVGGVDAKYQLFNIIQGATRYTYGNAFKQIGHSGVIAAEMTGAHFALTKVDNTIEERDVAYSTPFVCASTAFIFANNDGVGNAQYKGALAVSRCRIWQDGVNLTRDFVPVLDLDGVPCMYDLVTKQFYHNAGAGEFVPSLYPVDDPTQKYVTDGIVCMLDSIKNSASGHDSSTTTWKDLVGVYDMPLDLTKAQWRTNSCIQTADNLNSCISAEPVTHTVGTLEIVFSPSSVDDSWALALRDLYYGDNQDVQFCRYSGVYYQAFFDEAASYNSTLSGRRYACIAYDANYVRIYENGNLVLETARSSENAYSNKLQLFGWDSKHSKPGTDISAVRIYNRALTQAEVAQNYRVDKQRFNF